MADEDGGFLSDYKGHKYNFSDICFTATLTTSSGVWLGDFPLDFAFPVLLAQLTIIFVASRLSHAVLRPIGLPQPISHVIAGMLLGRTGLSRNRWFKEAIFPKRSWVHLDHISLVAFILFVFVVAVKTDLGLIRKSGRKAAAIAQVGTALPFVIIFISVIVHPSLHTRTLVQNYVLHFASRWSLTSYIVISCLLAEFQLLTSKLGRLALSASILADFYSVVITTGFYFFTALVYQTAATAFNFLCSFCGFIGLIWLVARPVAVWIIRRTPEGSAMAEAYFLTILLMALGSSIAGELIGQSVTLGPLFLGLIIPGGPPLGTAVVDRLDRLVSALFLPVFLIIAGLRSNLHDVLSGMLWAPMISLISLGVAAKFAGVILCCIYSKMSLRDGFILALILNSRGIIEINTFNNLEDFNELSGELYTVNIMGIIVVGGLSAMLLKALYRPSARLEVHRRRTVQARDGAGELRVLTCVHCEDHVPPLLTLVSAISPTPASPLCVYLLHLSPLVGRSSAVLAPYKKKQSSKSSFRALSSVSPSAAAAVSAAPAATVTDHIVNSFLSLERHHPAGILTVQPFVGVSPYATMHDDVCSLVVDKMCDLIIIPFHRRVDVDVALESVCPAVRSVNNNILHYSPCSVAILVNRGLSGGPAGAVGHRRAQRAAIFFLGGADDREALAIAARMAESPCISLYVLRLLLPSSESAGVGDSKEAEEEEEEMDDEAVEEFRIRREGMESVEYREEEVKEGAETVVLMREVSEKCELLIVGRGEGRVTPFTAGLEMWSEYPELGVIGDILASPDFGGKVSVLVVQQRSRAAGDRGGGLLKRAGSNQSSKASGSVDMKEGRIGERVGKFTRNDMI